METMRIESLSVSVSRICLGTWAMGGWMWGGADDQESIQTITTAFNRGINMIDTAPVYGFGRSENIVGKAIQQYGQRDRIVIATKVGLEWQGSKVFRNSSPERIRREVELSLTRLRTDYIDIYQIHWPDPKTPIEETAGVMLRLLEEGKIRSIGVSNFSPSQMEAFMKIAPIHTSQPPYNLFERGIETNLLPFTEKENIVSLCYGALCRGLLSGRMRPDTQFRGDDIRNRDPKFQAPRYSQYLAAVNELDAFAKKHYGKNILALALRWTLDKGNTIALKGARNEDQVQPVDDIQGWHLDQSAMLAIDEILQRNITDPVGPEFMAPPAKEDTLYV